MVHVYNGLPLFLFVSKHEIDLPWSIDGGNLWEELHADGWMDNTRLAFQASWTATSSLLLGWQEPTSVVDLTGFEEEAGG